MVDDLRSSCAELKERVEDPFPEAIKFANEVAESLRGKVVGDENAMQTDMDAPENCKGKDVISTRMEGTSNGIPKQSLMDRQPTASRYEVVFY